MNTAIVRPFVVATRRVFEKMLECPCRVGRPTVCRGLDSKGAPVRAIVEVSGDHQGFMVLQLPSALACVTASLLVAPKELGQSGQEKWAGDQIARLIKSLVRRHTNSGDMKFEALSNGDARFDDSVLRKQGAWLVVPMIGRFGRFSFAMCVKPVQATPATSQQVAAAG